MRFKEVTNVKGMKGYRPDKPAPEQKIKYRDFSPTKSDAMSAQAKAAVLKSKIDQKPSVDMMVITNKALRDVVANKDKLATNMSKTAGVDPKAVDKMIAKQMSKPMGKNPMMKKTTEGGGTMKGGTNFSKFMGYKQGDMKDPNRQLPKILKINPDKAKPKLYPKVDDKDYYYESKKTRLDEFAPALLAIATGAARVGAAAMRTIGAVKAVGTAAGAMVGGSSNADTTSAVDMGKKLAQVTDDLEITLDEDQDFEENFGILGYSIDENDMFEAEYQGRNVKLNKPMRGDVKKFKVYVKNKKGNVIKVNFGHGGTSAKRKTMRIRKSNPKARKSFRARHNCDNPGPKTKARYWSCRKW